MCLCCVCVCSVVVGIVGPGSIICLLPSNQEQWYLGTEQCPGTLRGGGGCAEEGVGECGCRWATWNWHGEYSSHFIHSQCWRSGTLWHAGVVVIDSARLLYGFRETSYLGAFVSLLVQ